MTRPIDRFLAEERAVAIAKANGEPIPDGWSVLSGTEICEAELHNAECLRLRKLGRKKRKAEKKE